MKVSNKILTAVIIITVAALAAYNIEAQGKIYKIGDKGPAGGWIFYDKGNSSGGWRYLEAALEDQGSAKWGCYGKTIPGANGTAIGTGKSNTQTIIKNCAEAGISAKVAVAYRGGGKSDWFLPSKDELILMYSNLHKAGKGGFKQESYWSSTDLNANSAYNHRFAFRGEGNLGEVGLKDNYIPVRPIRAF